MSYENYLTWMRLTHGGRRNRGEMNEAEQAEFDQQLKVVERMPSEEAAEWKRRYEATGRSDPASDA
jgi:hypothetical protein